MWHNSVSETLLINSVRAIKGSSTSSYHQTFAMSLNFKFEEGRDIGSIFAFGCMGKDRRIQNCIILTKRFELLQ